MSSSENKRIYVVLANTVQVPTTTETHELPAYRANANTGYRKMVPTCETKTIVQPAGRLIAQAAHVVSKVRSGMVIHAVVKLLDAFVKEMQSPNIKRIKDLVNSTRADISNMLRFEPVTTIVLAVRDSYELHHVYQLLKLNKVRVVEFHDYNQPDYGSISFEVRTAIATEPVEAEDVLGILDYLPLWKPLVS